VPVNLASIDSQSTRKSKAPAKDVEVRGSFEGRRVGGILPIMSREPHA